MCCCTTCLRPQEYGLFSNYVPQELSNYAVPVVHVVDALIFVYCFRSTAGLRSTACPATTCLRSSSSSSSPTGGPPPSAPLSASASSLPSSAVSCGCCCVNYHYFCFHLYLAHCDDGRSMRSIWRCIELCKASAASLPCAGLKGMCMCALLLLVCSQFCTALEADDLVLLPLLLLLLTGPLQGKAVAIVNNQGPGCQVGLGFRVFL